MALLLGESHLRQLLTIRDLAPLTERTLGAGVQARSHMEALLEVCRPVEVRVWTRTRAHADAFAREVADRHRVAAAASATAEEAVRGAEIVCTMTSSQTPVLRGRWLSPG